MALALSRSRGYRQLCSLWFEYDLCLNRKPPNDLESFLTTLIRIRSRSSLVSLAVCRPGGYWHLCAPWYEYDLCLNGKPPNGLESFFTTLRRIRSKSDPKGVKLWFEYDQKTPSGFGIAPIKRVPTAMFSLVRIRPMFEQEAPKWPWEVFNNPDSNTIQVGPKRG